MHFTAVSLMSSNSMTDKGEKRFFSSVELEELKEETKAKSSFPQRGTLGRVENTVNTSGHQMYAIIVEGDKPKSSLMQIKAVLCTSYKW